MARKLTALTVLLLLTTVFLIGQRMTAQLFGSVTNEEGEYLRGVVVTLTNLDNNGVIEAVSGKKKGVFRFPSIFPGVYQASFDLEGYQSYGISRIQLSAEQSLNLKIKLRKIKAETAQQQ